MKTQKPGRLAKGRLFKCGAAMLCVTLTAGCATQQGTDQATGAVLGALGGALVGGLTGGAKGAAIGAAGGAAIGWAAVKVTQVRSAEDDAQMYGMTAPVSTPAVTIRKSTNSPKQLRAGETLLVSTDYSVALPTSAPSADVETSWVLTRDGKVLNQEPPAHAMRTAGGYVAETRLDVPSDAAPGTYVLEHHVSSGETSDVAESTFVVTAMGSQAQR